MKNGFVKELARSVFNSIERDKPEVFEKTQHVIKSEYANNEISLLLTNIKELMESKTISDKKIIKRLEIIEKELLNIANELEVEIKISYN